MKAFLKKHWLVILIVAVVGLYFYNKKPLFTESLT